jgi:hypothetical protein
MNPYCLVEGGENREALLQVLLQERLVICYKGSDAVDPRSLETGHE